MPFSSGRYGFELGSDCSAKLSLSSSRKAKKGSSSSVVDAPGLSDVTARGEGGKRSGGASAKTNLSAEEAKAQQVVAMRKKRMMAIGSAPGKQLMMTGFMLWMSGNQLNIFSIMMTSMAIMNPVRSLMSMTTQFAPFSGMEGINQARATFILLNMVGISFALYKLAVLGLVPVKSTDWIALLEIREPEEILAPVTSYE